MKNIKHTLFVLFILFFHSCSNTPSCNQYDVEELIINAIKKEVKKELENNYYNEHYDSYDTYLYAKDNGLDISKFVTEKENEIKKQSKIYAEKQLKENITFRLEGVRLLKIQEKIKKCHCTSDIIITNKITNKEKHIDIEYTAQYTEDGDIYVEYYIK